MDAQDHSFDEIVMKLCDDHAEGLHNDHYHTACPDCQNESVARRTEWDIRNHPNTKR